jgi:hypothetical protein
MYLKDLVLLLTNFDLEMTWKVGRAGKAALL